MSAIPRNPPGVAQAVFLLGRGVLIELLRRRDFYVLLILMALFVAGTMAARMVGIGEASTATFLLNLGMSLAYFAAHVLTLVLAARQVPDEIENRTLYPLLAKPVTRPVVLLGKWTACTACGLGCYVVLLILGWLPVPKMEPYHWGTLLQHLLLQGCSLGVLAAMVIAFSLLLPKGVNIVLCGLVLAFGTKFIGFLNARANGSSAQDVVRWVTAYVPDFAKWNLTTRYTDGIAPLAAGEFFGLLVYATIGILLGLGIAVAAFQRRAL